MATQVDAMGMLVTDATMLHALRPLQNTKGRILRDIEAVEKFLRNYKEMAEATSVEDRRRSQSRKMLARVREVVARRRVLIDQLYSVQKQIINVSRAPSGVSSDISVQLTCFDFMFSMSRARAHMLRCMQDWCQYQPLPGLPVADQHLFAVCVFAMAPVEITLSTRRGVCLFTDYSPVADHLFGEDARLNGMSAYAPADVVVDYSRRKFRSDALSVASFNIPFDCVPEDALVALYRLVSALCPDGNGNLGQPAFVSRGVDGVSGETTLAQFKFNAYLDENAAPLRKQLVLLYVANMIVSSARSASVGTLHTVVRNLLFAMDSALTHLHLMRGARAMSTERPVRELLEGARRINRSTPMLAALLDSVRRQVCYDALDAMAHRYHNSELETVLDVLGGFMSG